MSKPLEMEPNINSVFFVKKSSRTSAAPVNPSAVELRRRLDAAQAKIEEHHLEMEVWDE